MRTGVRSHRGQDVTVRSVLPSTKRRDDAAPLVGGREAPRVRLGSSEPSVCCSQCKSLWGGFQWDQMSLEPMVSGQDFTGPWTEALSLTGGNWSCWGHLASWGKSTGDRDHLAEAGSGCRPGARPSVGLLSAVLCAPVSRGRRGPFWLTPARAGCSHPQ